jgi:hypothetical protein
MRRRTKLAAIAAGVLVLLVGVPAQARSPHAQARPKPSKSPSASPTPSASASPSPSPTQPPPPPPPSGGYWSDKYRQWPNGPNPTGDPAFYPIGVWLQNPDRVRNGQPNAINYKNAGVTHDVGISSWPGCDWCPNEEDALVAGQWPAWLDAANGAGKARVDANPALAPWVRAWLLSDEADMAHSDPADTFAYPTNYRDYGAAMRALDPSRPTYSNFGKGMSIQDWVGYQYWQPGGTGTYEGDMALYCQSSDIVSADYYGWTDQWEPADYKGAWTYGQVIDSIRHYCGPDKLALGFVETGHPDGSTADNSNWITPDELEASVWSIVAHGGNGWVYFAHNFLSTGMVEDGLFDDPAMTARVTAVDAAVKALASVLNAQSQPGVSVVSTNGIPVAYQYKPAVSGSRYIVAQADGDRTHTGSGATTATFTVAGMADGTAEVVGEGRTVPIVAGQLVDAFAAYGHHVYRF